MSTTEVYAEFDGKSIRVYHFDDDGNLAYAGCFEGTDEIEDAVNTFVALTAQELDPIEAGWELERFESIDQAQAEYDLEAGNLIASSDWYNGREEDMVRGDADDYDDNAAVAVFVSDFIGDDEEL